MSSQKNIAALAICIVTAVCLFGCQGMPGTLVVKLCDAQFPIEFIEEANVTINKLEGRNTRVRGYPFITLSTAIHTYNLLDLQNGLTADLATVLVPAGEYDLLRLFVSEANITLTDQTIFDLAVPSGGETGIEIYVDPPIAVFAGLTSEILLDFDVSQSFVVLGNPDTLAGIEGFLFTPVIRASNLSTPAGVMAGEVAGRVADDLGAFLEDVLVSIELTPDLTANSFTAESGRYTLLGIPEGTYRVTVSKDGYVPASVSAVAVIAGQATEVDFVLIPETEI